MIFGYCRISTDQQQTDLQMDALNRVGCDRIFTDTASGAKQDRPGLAEMLGHVREGDTVLVWKIDRLARNTRHMLELVEGFDTQGVEFRSITEGITNQGSVGRLTLTIMAAVATLERETIVERTRAGLDAAKLRGKVGGRPPKLSPKQVERARKLKSSGEFTVAEIAAMLSCSVPTVYRAVATEKASS